MIASLASVSAIIDTKAVQFRAAICTLHATASLKGVRT